MGLTNRSQAPQSDVTTFARAFWAAIHALPVPSIATRAILHASPLPLDDGIYYNVRIEHLVPVVLADAGIHGAGGGDFVDRRKANKSQRGWMFSGICIS